MLVTIFCWGAGQGRVKWGTTLCGCTLEESTQLWKRCFCSLCQGIFSGEKTDGFEGSKRDAPLINSVVTTAARKLSPKLSRNLRHWILLLPPFQPSFPFHMARAGKFLSAKQRLSISDCSNAAPQQRLKGCLPPALTSIWSGFCWTAASKNRTALGRSPSSKHFRPSSNACGWSRTGLSSSNWYPYQAGENQTVCLLACFKEIPK